ncbi:MAG TPA: HD domain-containing protein [Kouleothrix sp.]|nr:HD domain-containing protein [Kouleothrix sp.]HRC76792.1 HD domain-containing protein [Kouleothrix sp.]
MPAYSQRYDAALALAARAHRAQLRKGTDLPYIAHPVHVALILERYGFGEELAIAGLLHDVVEDTDVPIERIRDEFGDAVAQLVAAATETKRANGAELPWEERKAEKLERLRTSGPEVAALKAADALHNTRSLIRDLMNEGPAVWARFKRGPRQSIDYYAAIGAGVRAKLGDHGLATELDAAVADLRRVAEQIGPG